MGKKINTWVFITNPNQTRLSPPFWRQVNVVCCACNNILCVQQCQFKNLDALAIMHSIFSNLLIGWAYSGNFISIMWFLLESISIFSLGKKWSATRILATLTFTPHMRNKGHKAIAGNRPSDYRSYRRSGRPYLRCISIQRNILFIHVYRCRTC